MKRLLPIAVAFAIVAVLVSIKVRSRTKDEAVARGTWELADDTDTSGAGGTTEAS